MSRKTHPISHRMGVTWWWPSRMVGARRAAGRYTGISELITGVMWKYGYGIASPRIKTTVERGKAQVVTTTGTSCKKTKEYIMEYLSAIITEYEQKNYKVEMRCGREKEAGQIGAGITRTSKSIVMALVEQQRRLKRKNENRSSRKERSRILNTREGKNRARDNDKTSREGRARNSGKNNKVYTNRGII